MKYYKTITEERKVLDRVACDMCMHDFRNGLSGCDVQSTELSYEFGEIYPEGRFTKTLMIDICPDCFENKLIPWLESQKVTMQEIDSDD